MDGWIHYLYGGRCIRGLFSSAEEALRIGHARVKGWEVHKCHAVFRTGVRRSSYSSLLLSTPWISCLTPQGPQRRPTSAGQSLYEGFMGGARTKTGFSAVEQWLAYRYRPGDAWHS